MGEERVSESNSEGSSRVAKERGKENQRGKENSCDEKSGEEAGRGKKTSAENPAASVNSSAGTPIFSQRERYEMIAQMAYFRAEKRGFEPGGEQQDWLESEKLIDKMLSDA